MKITSLSDLEYVEVSHNPLIKKRIMLANGEFPNIVNFSQAVFPVGEIAGAHKHDDMNEIFFVHSGIGVINIDGVNYPLEEGVCAAVEAGEVHKIQNTGTENLVLNYFAIKLG